MRAFGIPKANRSSRGMFIRSRYGWNQTDAHNRGDLPGMRRAMRAAIRPRADWAQTDHHNRGDIPGIRRPYALRRPAMMGAYSIGPQTDPFSRSDKPGGMSRRYQTLGRSLPGSGRQTDPHSRSDTPGNLGPYRTLGSSWSQVDPHERGAKPGGMPDYASLGALGQDEASLDGRLRIIADRFAHIMTSINETLPIQQRKQVQAATSPELRDWIVKLVAMRTRPTDNEWFPWSESRQRPSQSRYNRLVNAENAMAGFEQAASSFFQIPPMTQSRPLFALGEMVKDGTYPNWNFASPPGGTVAQQQEIDRLRQTLDEYMNRRDTAATDEEKAQLESVIQQLQMQIANLQKRANGNGISTNTLLLVGGGILAAAFILPKLLGGRGRV